MAVVTWSTVDSVVSLLTTELNTIASGSGSAYGPEINNTSGAQFGTLVLTIASNSLAFTSTSFVSVCMVPSTTPNASGGNYPTYTSGSSYKLAVQNYIVGDIFINPATQSATVVRETLAGVPIPSGYFKAILLQSSGVTWPASGNTLSLFGTKTSVA